MYVYPKKYDVIVVGGGHAGVEAALASARMGCSTLLLTLNLDSIGQMSCNPAIGGSAKGHLVREIDALGGEMGFNTDMTGLQFRMLNTRKGPAVWAPRAQCDKKAYQFRLKHVCERQANLDCKQAETTALVVEGERAIGVETRFGVRYHGMSLVITTGTFLRGLLHIGSDQASGGRAGEAAAMGLSASLKEFGIRLGRLKTGTPPRLNRRSIDFSRLERQGGDDPVPYFTHWKDELFHVEQSGDQTTTFSFPPESVLERAGGQIPCHITYTTELTAQIIRNNLHRSPMYSGVIEGVGPRYCPSIEDKIVKFPEKGRHQIFLEPEGNATDEIYVNGFSTCLPFEVQVELVRTVVGCERAEIMRPAYAVEYDFADPTQLKSSLESKVIEGLFLAGQINGTSGYEEAGAQGIVAGINAARRVQSKPPLILRRDQAYIGVLIDDLITKGTIEPYRMFTSRSEYRLWLRQDNADIRLCDMGREMGLLSESRHNRFRNKRDAIDQEIARLNRFRHGSETLSQLLRRPETTYRTLPNADSSLPEDIAQQVEITLKYAGYIKRQEVDIQRLRSMEAKQIPEGFDFTSLHGLRAEARQKLNQIRPRSIGQAERISGVTPADIAVLLVALRRFQHQVCPSAETTESEC